MPRENNTTSNQLSYNLKNHKVYQTKNPNNADYNGQKIYDENGPNCPLKDYC